MMGVERAVTLWYVQQQFIVDEIAQLEAHVALAEAADPSMAPKRAVEGKEAELRQALAGAYAKLRALGPCPKPMMG